MTTPQRRSAGGTSNGGGPDIRRIPTLDEMGKRRSARPTTTTTTSSWSFASYCKVIIGASFMGLLYLYLSSNNTENNSSNYLTNKHQAIHQVELLNRFETTSCPSACFQDVSSTCDLELCQHCEYTCNMETECKFYPENARAQKLATENLQGVCKDWCMNPQDNKHDVCTKYPDKCKSCAICATNTFKDMTRYYFIDKYWYEWKHSGRPYKHNDSPLFVDIDGDGILDLFDTLHGHAPDEHGNDRWELALGKGYKGYDGSTKIAYVPVASERIQITDDPNLHQDPHGRNVLDLDGDDIDDIYVDQGGDEGKQDEEAARERVSFLLWGEKHHENENKVIYRGGRQEAIEAGVDMYYGRGRVNYFFDANLDGLLDLFVYQDRNVGNMISPGVLLYNNGDRTWSRSRNNDKTLHEFTRAMIVTDADGDGIAQEVVLNRNFCYPQRKGPDIDPDVPEHGPYTDEAVEFCSSRPVGTTVVFKAHPKGLKQISPDYLHATPDKYPGCCPNGAFSTSQNCNAKSMASADLDGDLRADLLVLFKTKWLVYFSSDRKQGELPIGNAGLEITVPKPCTSTATIRVLDLDNDGTQEILVVCQMPVATAFVYTKQDDSGKKWTLNNAFQAQGALGDLANPNLVGFTKQDFADSCSVDASRWHSIGEACDYHKGKTDKPPPVVLEGVSTVDINNDGFTDLVVSYSFGYTRFLENIPRPNIAKNKYIAFTLVGAGPKRGSNVYGIGASVILHVKFQRHTRAMFHEFNSYQHTPDWYGYKDDRIVFGLGEKGKPEKVSVRWPDGSEQEVSLKDWTFTPGVYQPPVRIEQELILREEI